MTKKEFIEKYGEEEYQKKLEHKKQYYQQHKDDKKQYYQQHREEKKQYQKQYDQQHRDERKQYYQQHRDEKRQYYKQQQRKVRCMFAYCIPEEIEKIENYELAKKDNFIGWHIHHRLECVETGAVVNSTRQDLIDWGIYYNRPASELIFLTASEHGKLHRRAKNRSNH